MKGLFKDSLPTAPIERLSILRLDGDLYESTMDILDNLCAKVSPGGFVIIDDYFLDCCRAAVTDFRKAHDITSPLIEIDSSSKYWRA